MTTAAPEAGPVHQAGWPAGDIVVLDVGGTSVKSGIVFGGTGALLPDHSPIERDPVDSNALPEPFADAVAAIIVRLLARCRAPVGIALSFPGPADYARGVPLIRGLAKFEALYGIDLKAMLARRIGDGWPIVFVPDAQAAAFGEALARGLERSALVITLGTGLGSVFLDGTRVSPKGLRISPSGELNFQPAQGSIADDVFSIRGLDRRLAPHGRSCAGLAHLSTWPHAAIAEIEAFGADLGTWLTPHVLAAEMDEVIVGGGLSNLFPVFGRRLEAVLPVPVSPARLGEAAPIIGAAFDAFARSSGTGV